MQSSYPAMLDLRDSQFPEAPLISDSSEAERVEKVGVCRSKRAYSHWAPEPRGSKNPNGSVAPNCSDGWNGGGVAASSACAECTNISLKVRTWMNLGCTKCTNGLRFNSNFGFSDALKRNAVNIPNWFWVGKRWDIQ